MASTNNFAKNRAMNNKYLIERILPLFALVLALGYLLATQITPLFQNQCNDKYVYIEAPLAPSPPLPPMVFETPLHAPCPMSIRHIEVVIPEINVELQKQMACEKVILRERLGLARETVVKERGLAKEGEKRLREELLQLKKELKEQHQQLRIIVRENH